MNKTQKSIIAFKAGGGIIPKCINSGCDKNVAIRRPDMPPRHPSFKTECSSCSTNRTAGKKRPGITYHKKTYCENIDGFLGFNCFMNPERYEEANDYFTGTYHMDHLDGNHENNVPENVKTFCSICHGIKGKQSGDFNSWKDSSVRGRR